MVALIHRENYPYSTVRPYVKTQGPEEVKTEEVYLPNEATKDRAQNPMCYQSITGGNHCWT